MPLMKSSCEQHPLFLLSILSPVVRVLEREFIVITCRFRNHFARVSSIEPAAVCALERTASKMRQIILPCDASHGRCASNVSLAHLFYIEVARQKCFSSPIEREISRGNWVTRVTFYKFWILFLWANRALKHSNEKIANFYALTVSSCTIHGGRAVRNERPANGKIAIWDRWKIELFILLRYGVLFHCLYSLNMLSVFKHWLKTSIKRVNLVWIKKPKLYVLPGWICWYVPVSMMHRIFDCSKAKKLIRNTASRVSRILSIVSTNFCVSFPVTKKLSYQTKHF